MKKASLDLTMDCFRFFLGITTSSQRAFSAELLSFISNHTAVLGFFFWANFLRFLPWGFHHHEKKITIWENSLGFLWKKASNNQIQERRHMFFPIRQGYNPKAMSCVGSIFSANQQNSSIFQNAAIHGELLRFGL